MGEEVACDIASEFCRMRLKISLGKQVVTGGTRSIHLPPTPRIRVLKKTDENLHLEHMIAVWSVLPGPITQGGVEESNPPPPPGLPRPLLSELEHLPPPPHALPLTLKWLSALAWVGKSGVQGWR